MTLLLNVVSGGHSARMAIDALASEGIGVVAGQLRWARQQHDLAGPGDGDPPAPVQPVIEGAALRLAWAAGAAPASLASAA
jgi:hypothetical protein